MRHVLMLPCLLAVAVAPAAWARPVPGQAASGACLEGPAPFVRVFRGLRRPDLSPQHFAEGLARRFVPAGVQAHSGKGLSAYMVALAPDPKPSGLADEFSFLAYPSAAVYQARREAPEVKAFGELHWAFFQLAPASRSDTAQPLGDRLLPEAPVDLLGQAVDWQAGHNEFFVGQRLPAVCEGSYLPRLRQHLLRTREAFAGQGLLGQVVVASPPHAMVWSNWRSREAAERARNSPAGRALLLEGAALLRTVQWAIAKPFAGALRPGALAQVRVEAPGP